MKTGLSKSRLLAFLQCEKRLWLHVNGPKVEPSRAVQRRLAVGEQVGARARAEYSDGVLIDADGDWNEAVRVTETELKRAKPRPLFEATFGVNGLLVRADLLVPEPSGYSIIEVKSTTKPKPYHIPDAAIQTWVARQNGLSVGSTSIRHLDKKFVYTREGDYQGLFATTPVDDAVAAEQADIPKWIGNARAVLAGQEPRTGMGAHCSEPFDCPFRDYCAGKEPLGPEYPLAVLPGKKGKALARKLEKEGYVALTAVPAKRFAHDALFTRIHLASCSGEGFVDVEGARRALGDWGYPRYYFDFETIAFAVPRWIGTRPYQQIPFQWSCHIDRGRGDVEHVDFLDLSGDNPARACAEKMLATLGDKGPIVAYHAQFEKGVIATLAELLPDLKRWLLALRERVVDLLPIVREHYYHPAMKGSFSIKSVLPTIAPALDYSELEEVRNGGMAGVAYLEAIDAATLPERKVKLSEELTRYCRRDTEGMVLVARALI